MSFAPKRPDIEKFLGPNALPEWVDALARLAPQLCKFYRVSRLQWVHFIGQIAAETNGMSIRDLTENMNYTSASRILQIFSYRLGLALKTPQYARFQTRAALARHLVRKPDELAKVVYSNREGTPANSGHLYRGRGPLQTTHLDNYRRAGEEVARQPGGGKFDLVANPELLSTDPELGVRVAFAEWKLKGLGIWAERDDVDVVSDILNTGNHKDNVFPHNLNGRRRWVAKAKVIWPNDLMEEEAEVVIAGAPKPAEPMFRPGDRGAEVEALQKRLHELGYFTGQIDGKYGPLTERAVRAFQSEHGLKDDGIAGPKTIAVLKDSAPVDLGPRKTMTAQDLKKRGSRTISVTRWAKRLIEFVFGGGVAAILDGFSGLGLIETVLTQGERVASIISRTLALSSQSPEYGAYVLGGLAIAVLLGLAWLAFDRIEKYRVSDAQSGAHLGR